MTERTLIERLRGYTESDAYAEPWTFGVTCREAADALDAKDAEIARLRAALNPLALLLYGADHDGHSDDDLVTDPEATPTVGDLRRAARAIRNSE